MNQAFESERAWSILEIKPDNLNKGVYDLFLNGDYHSRVTLSEDKIIPTMQANGVFLLDYIKYLPMESFTIKNDEVWVKEVRGSSYSIKELNWEMIGFSSDVRPATIRNLNEQTEVPAPQIYVNLINNRL